MQTFRMAVVCGWMCGIELHMGLVWRSQLLHERPILHEETMKDKKHSLSVLLLSETKHNTIELTSLA